MRGETKKDVRVAWALGLCVLGPMWGNTANAAEPEDDFAARCAQADVVKCVGFDDAAVIAGNSESNSGVLSGATTPTLDESTRASGTSSLMFEIPSDTGADTSGSYFTNFSEDLTVQFGGDQEFYVQWRQRFSTEFIAAPYSGGNGWKQLIIGTGQQPTQQYYSCTALEVVTQNTRHRGFSQMYNSCTGSASHGPYDPFEQGWRDYDFKLQNARPKPFCLYSQGQAEPPTYFPSDGSCFGYSANEWMTFQVGIETGPRVGNEFIDSRIRLWVAREGEQSELVIDWGPYSLAAGPEGEMQRFGKVWLLPYNTGKDSRARHPTAFTWYDELIISGSRIVDPASGPSVDGDDTGGADPTESSGSNESSGRSEDSSAAGESSAAAPTSGEDTTNANVPSVEGDNSEPSGCGCRQGKRPNGWLVIGFVAFARRRRRLEH